MAMLQWTILYITYTPETYTVIYGTDPSLLDQTSQSVTGNSDITTTDQILSIQLDGLVHDTTYYYQVVATNTHNSTASTVASFVTVPLRKLIHVSIQGLICTQDLGMDLLSINVFLQLCRS